MTVSLKANLIFTVINIQVLFQFVLVWPPPEREVRASTGLAAAPGERPAEDPRPLRAGPAVDQLEVCTLQGKPHLCITFLGIARPQSQFPHSCVCERFIYSQDRSTYFPSAEQAGRSWKYINHSQICECRNWETEHYTYIFEIKVSFLGIYKWESANYIGFSPALHLQCRQQLARKKVVLLENGGFCNGCITKRCVITQQMCRIMIFFHQCWFFCKEKAWKY